MMIGEGQWRQRLHPRTEVVDHLLRTSYAREQEDIIVLQFIFVDMLCTFIEERVGTTIVERCEEQRLIGEEVHSLCQHTEVDRVQTLRTFRDDDDVGAVLALHRFTKPSGRQQLIVDNQSMIIDEQDVYSRFDISVLIGIIEDDDIGIISLLIAYDMLYPRTRLPSTAMFMSGNFSFIWYGSSPMVRMVAFSSART